jgi:hypothetical protein
MPEPLLNILKFCLLALLYLFFFRVLRAVWAELRPAPPQPSKVARPQGAPRAVRRSGAGGRLKVVEPAEQRGRSYEVAEEVTVGRAPGCGVALDDTYVSQLHARLFRQNGQLFVEDLGSTNGTYVNRKKVTGPLPVRRGDRLQVGRTVLEVTR